MLVLTFAIAQKNSLQSQPAYLKEKPKISKKFLKQLIGACSKTYLFQ